MPTPSELARRKEWIRRLEAIQSHEPESAGPFPSSEEMQREGGHGPECVGIGRQMINSFLSLFGLRLVRINSSMDNHANSTDAETPYGYSGPQQKMLRLYELLRESLRFEKYYAFQLKRYRLLNIIGDASIAIAASGSLTTAKFMKTTIGGHLLTGTLIFSTFATILKPVLKLSDKIVRLSKLQIQYLELYQEFNTLRHEIQESGVIQAKHEKQLTGLQDRFNRLGLQNDPAENQKLMLRFQDEVENEIPNVRLWLPQDATEKPATETDSTSS